MRRIVVLGASALVVVSASAALKLAGPFTDGAILQRERPVPVWGLAGPGNTVKVSFAGAERTVKADAAGRWRVDLPPMVACPDIKDEYDWTPSLKWNGKNPKSLWPHSRVKDQTSVIWNAMVTPLCPYSIRGFIWYQGEANARMSERYTSQMHALYNGWSLKFENPDLKLYFAQLAPKSEDTVKIWEAQDRFAKEQKNAAKPVKLRYAYSNPWKGTIYNEADLPLGSIFISME